MAAKKSARKSEQVSTPKQGRSVKKVASKATAAKQSDARQPFITVTMPESLKQAVMAKAEKTGIPMAQAARILLESWVGADLIQTLLDGRETRRNVRRAPKAVSKRTSNKKPNEHAA